LRSLDEIAATLDEQGRTDQLPFMREMLELQGQSLLVESRADKTCDTINLTGCNRQMTDTVHLVGARCTGRFHGGCQAYCLLFFNESWLEPTSERRSRSDVADGIRHDADNADNADNVDNSDARAELEDRLARFADAGPDTYRCQATQLLEASEPLTGRSHYLDDLRNRNVPIGRFAKGMAYLAVNRYQRFSQEHLPARLRFRGGRRLPDLEGQVVDGDFPVTPALDLQPGELVEVRGKDEIARTLDADRRNRGLRFDEEMLNLCGKRGRVLFRVERLIDEKTGRMLRVKKDLYVVAGMVGCEGVYHRLCTRGMIGMMREAWLRRVA